VSGLAMFAPRSVWAENIPHINIKFC
jgi:hypothetical protein